MELQSIIYWGPEDKTADVSKLGISKDEQWWFGTVNTDNFRHRRWCKEGKKQHKEPSERQGQWN